RGGALVPPVAPPPVAGRGADADAVEPCGEGGATLERREPAVDDQEHLLAHVLHIVLLDAEPPEGAPYVGHVLLEDAVEALRRRRWFSAHLVEHHGAHARECLRHGNLLKEIRRRGPRRWRPRSATCGTAHSPPSRRRG